MQGSSSGWRAVNSSVPQGSVLGQVLFIIYLNDTTEQVISSIKILADDTKLFSSVFAKLKLVSFLLPYERTSNNHQLN